MVTPKQAYRLIQKEARTILGLNPEPMVPESYKDSQEIGKLTQMGCAHYMMLLANDYKTIDALADTFQYLHMVHGIQVASKLDKPVHFNYE